MDTPSKRKRPEVLPGVTAKIVTGCGNMYVTANSDEGGLFEVFAKLGKAGTCVTCYIEALTRMVSLGLRYGVPVQEVVKQLKGIRCPQPTTVPEEDSVLSCPDGISKALSSEKEPRGMVVEGNVDYGPLARPGIVLKKGELP